MSSHSFEPAESIATRVRQGRESAGLSQGQLAKLLGMHRPTISEIEAGRRRLTADELREFARAFGVQVAWLAGEDVDPLLGVDALKLAARDMERLRKDDLDKVLELIRSLAPSRDQQ